METLGATLEKKAIETLRASRASKIKSRYYCRHTRNKKGKWSLQCTRLQVTTSIKLLCRGRKKDRVAEGHTLGNKVAK